MASVCTWKTTKEDQSYYTETGNIHHFCWSSCLENHMGSSQIGCNWMALSTTNRGLQKLLSIIRKSLILHFEKPTWKYSCPCKKQRWPQSCLSAILESSLLYFGFSSYFLSDNLYDSTFRRVASVNFPSCTWSHFIFMKENLPVQTSFKQVA